jgi:hypothetical protein
MKFAIPFTKALFALFIATLTTASSVEQRGSSWLSVLEALVEKATDSALASVLCSGCDSPPACVGFGEASNLWTNAGVYNTPADGPKVWNTCWVSGAYTLTSYDVNAMACLINYHVQQADVCISTAGTICANYYTGPVKASRGWRGHNYFPSQDEVGAMVEGLLGKSIGVQVEITNDRTIDPFTIVMMQDNNITVATWFDFWFTDESLNC